MDKRYRIVDGLTANDVACMPFGEIWARLMQMGKDRDAKCAEAARMREALEFSPKHNSSCDTEDWTKYSVTNRPPCDCEWHNIRKEALTPDDGWLARRDAELKADAQLLGRSQMDVLRKQLAATEAERVGLAKQLLNMQIRAVNAETKSLRTLNADLARIRREAKAQALREAAEHMGKMPEAWGAEKAGYFGRLISAELRLLANREEAANE